MWDKPLKWMRSGFQPVAREVVHEGGAHEEEEVEEAAADGLPAAGCGHSLEVAAGSLFFKRRSRRACSACCADRVDLLAEALNPALDFLDPAAHGRNAAGHHLTPARSTVPNTGAPSYLRSTPINFRPFAAALTLRRVAGSRKNIATCRPRQPLHSRACRGVSMQRVQRDIVAKAPTALACSPFQAHRILAPLILQEESSSMPLPARRDFVANLHRPRCTYRSGGAPPCPGSSAASPHNEFPPSRTKLPHSAPQPHARVLAPRQTSNANTPRRVPREFERKRGEWSRDSTTSRKTARTSRSFVCLRARHGTTDNK